MIKGLLIINAFLDTPQVRQTYDMLLAGAKRAGIDMGLAVNSDFYVNLGSGRVLQSKGTGLEEARFVLFWNKDVFLGRALERSGYRLYNPADAIEACDNKALTYERLGGVCRMPKTIKIPMTFDTVGYGDVSFEEYLGSALGYPYVIKECLGSYGDQVYLAKDSASARSILKKIEGRDCLAQEYIETSSGRDLRAYVVGDRVAAAMVRHNPDDFRSNIKNGGTAEPYRITKQQEEMAVCAVKKLGLDFAGVDMLFDEEDAPLLCEVNSNAQFKGLLEATGTDICDDLFSMIASGVRGR